MQPPLWLLFFFLMLLPNLSVVYCATLLHLERSIPLNHRIELQKLKDFDRARHARLLQGFAGGVVDFSVTGTSDPYLVGLEGSSSPLLYFTKVKLGSPPREFNVQIDTGSDVLWIACNSCNNCPQSSGLGIPLSAFDSASSSSARLVSCSDPLCSSLVQTSATQCATQSNQCSYTFQYGDGSGTSGYYVYDAFYFNAVVGESMVANSSAFITFGCSTYQSGDLTKTDKAVDGIFGFGQGKLSVISQLSSRGITPRVFSHCLKGEANGGGILVLGEIMEPDIVYSPLVPSQPHYNLNLRSISVNGQLLQIDPAAFATSNSRGTIIDSGTTLAYLVAEAYDQGRIQPMASITANVSQFVTPMISKGNQCYLVPTSIDEIFPSVSLNFDGASMVLKPEEYLMHSGFSDGAMMWCMGFQRTSGVSILGDIVLKDKIFVYDLVRQRIGWANYDCSSSVNVSVVTSKDFINAGQLSSSSSPRDILLKLLLLTFVILSMHIESIVSMEFQIL